MVAQNCRSGKRGVSRHQTGHCQPIGVTEDTSSSDIGGVNAMARTTGNLEISCSCCGNAPHLPGGRMTSRRTVLSTGLAAGVALAASNAMLPGRAFAQSTLSPDAAMQALVDGNKRFVDKKLTSF